MHIAKISPEVNDIGLTNQTDSVYVKSTYS